MRLLGPDGNLPPSRRAVAASLFTVGYAPAALSACASPITTASDALVLEDVHVTGAGGYSLPAYVARPSGRGRHACVVVVNEIFGIHEYIKDVCRRFAHQGYAAIAPDYFDRAGDPSTLTDMAAIRPIVASATYDQVMGDTTGAIAWMKAQSFAKDVGFGITGFCWGGSWPWLASARIPDVKAGVAWYGRLVGPQTPATNDPNRPWPIDVAGDLKAPVLGLYGAHDQGIPVATVEQMRAALAAAGNPTHSEIIVYEDAGHGFHADYRDSYVAADATDGWNRLLAWFRAAGVA